MITHTQKALRSLMNVRQNEAWLLSLALLAWLVLLSILCLLPFEQSGPSLPYSDKLGHLLLFGMGGLILGWRGVLPMSLSGLLLLGHGALLELLQASGGFRFAEWADLLADGIGAVLGLLLARQLSVNRQ